MSNKKGCNSIGKNVNIGNIGKIVKQGVKDLL